MQHHDRGLFYGQPSRYLWEDSVGVVHNVDQDERGEQGDAMMPLLFSMGQHAALQAMQGRSVAGKRLMAFLDDVHVAPPTPGEVGGPETSTFARLLAKEKAKARSEPSVLRRRVEQAWRLKWGALLACGSARAFAASFVDLRPCSADGAIPHAHEVWHDFRCSGFSGLSVFVVRLTDSLHFISLYLKIYLWIGGLSNCNSDIRYF